ncbi:hypothetical protein INT47_006671 [Mucor saturninus]|uniref:SEC7 domain-containing protein n=1 Tax=Mucor saturninus TaxID=64648 RepID=A0A8H7QTS6_9FUNG|nr:hypothetical protein INT47_006671 [Mucor saturninus]
MLPNSRIIPSSNNNKNLRTRSNSTSAAFDCNGQQKKGFISRLLANPTNNNNSRDHPYYPSRPKYESVLGIQHDTTAAWGKPSEKTSLKSSSSTGSATGFGKLFKKRGKTLDDSDNFENLDDDLPKVRPIHNSSIRRKHTKIPLAPPPVVLKRNTQQPDSLLTDLPDQYITKRPSLHLNNSDNASLRKSSGSYSIYSTFGGNGNGSLYSVEVAKKDKSVDSFMTVVTTLPDQPNIEDNSNEEETNEEGTNEDTNEDDDEDTTTTNEDSDDEFVDATGSSQEDIEREKRLEMQSNLSKRLSGGHFGSAGGLLLSINEPPVPQRRSLNQDDELSKSMLNWKRHSDSGKRWSLRATTEEEQKHASTITVIDLRSTLSIPQIDVPEEEEELSVPDKLALRQKAQEALDGNDTRTESTTELFSKTLDDVWKTMDENKLELFHQDTPSPKEPDMSDKVKETALQLWKEDETTVTKERMAEWLGQGKPFHSAVLYQYMDYFYFTDMRLDSAFRKLCSKLYFKAEAQQIDRILESFAHRYWDCNPGCLFGSADIVYAVVYSLLLLNTDLHVAQGNHARMTRSEFIRNTMSTIRDQRDHEALLGHSHPPHHPTPTKSSTAWEAEVEATIKEMYVSVKQYQILQPLGRKSSLTKRSSMMGKRVIGIKRSVNSIIRKSGRESIMLDDLLVPPPSTASPPPPSTIRSSMSSGYNRPFIRSPRRDSFSSATSSSATSLSSRCTSPTNSLSPPPPTTGQSMMGYMNNTHLFSSRPPYFKEGVVMRKHLLENATHKARHREWRECFLEVGPDGLRMFALLQNNGPIGDKSLFRHSSLFEKSSTPHKWTASSQLIGEIELNHTLANPLPPPGYNRQRPHVFAIQQSDGGVYLFQVASSEQTQEWVSTCNYWAARESKEPLPGGVGNMEYGWGECLSDVILDLDAMRRGQEQKQHVSQVDPDTILIGDWLPPTATMVSSAMDEKEQYEMLQKHLVELNHEINQHRDIKTKIMLKFPTRCANYGKVMHNWEARSKYLLHDIIKYQNYCDALEKSLQKRPKPVVTECPVPLSYQTSQVDLLKEINQDLFLL